MIPKRVHNFGTFFISSQTWERRSIFQSDELAKLLIDTMFHYQKETKFLLHEFVIMPNHLHAIITPQQITLERAVQFIKGGYSFRVRQTGRENLEIWQHGFTDHRIRDAADYEKYRTYIHSNPVRAGLCQRSSEYPWSSAVLTSDLDPVPQRLKPLSLAADRRG